MKKILILSLAFIMLTVLSACTQQNTIIPEGFVLVNGGYFKNENSNLYQTNVKVSDFYISQYEVTQKEWLEVMGDNPAEVQGDNLPIVNVSWYDVIEYCNERSIKEGLTPYYNIDKENKDPNNLSEDDKIKWTVTINARANGYRLPTEVEWEYAASGGQDSKNYLYSGSNSADDVAWYFRNSGDEYLTEAWYWAMIEANNSQIQPVGQKQSNELGLYDMSGNVREWCWDWIGENTVTESGEERVIRGGGWIGEDVPCEISYRSSMEAHYAQPDLGLRVSRNR